MNKVVAERDIAIKSAADLREEVRVQKGEIEDLRTQLADWEDYHQQYVAQFEHEDWFDVQEDHSTFDTEQPLGAEYFNIAEDEVKDWGPKATKTPSSIPPKITDNLCESASESCVSATSCDIANTKCQPRVSCY